MLTSDQTAFLQEAITDAKTVHAETGIIVSGQVAQVCLESAWGKRRPGNNCYGIKPHPCPYVASVQNFTTHEVLNGKNKELVLSFAAYNSLVDCFRCHALILKKNFPNAAAAKTPEEYAKFLHYDPATKLSYATDPNYQSNIMAVVNSHNLKQYDQEAETCQKYLVISQFPI